MIDAEIDTRARDLLTRIINDINDWPVSPLEKTLETESGELIPVYGASSTEGYGSFRCEYMPLDAIKKMLFECERIYGEFEIIISDKLTGESVKKSVSEIDTPENRATAISLMSYCATLHLISYFRIKVCGLLEECVRDCELIAESALAALLSAGYSEVLAGEITPDQITADARTEIEKAAKRVAEQKRVLLRKAIRGLPNVIAERGPGAPVKSSAEREREGRAYAARVEDAYRKVRLETGSKPTKTKVAKELGEGGVNPRKGSDTSLSAFGNKLRRLNVDYDAIVRKVESELNNNS